MKQFNESYHLISSSCEQWILYTYLQNNSGSTPRRKFQEYKYYFYSTVLIFTMILLFGILDILSKKV